MKNYFKAFTAWMLLSAILLANTINVPGDQPTIQAGIDAASGGDLVLVQPGTYSENISFNGKDIMVASLFYTTQDTSYISQTIIDGGQNSSVVLFNSGEDSNSVLMGFKIQNGQSDKGGGIYCDFSSPKMSYLNVTNNTAIAGFGTGGGGICIEGSNAIIEETLIHGNISNGTGGGIHLSGSEPKIRDSKIFNNSAITGNGRGAGVYISAQNPTLKSVKIFNNSCETDGGAIYFDESGGTLKNIEIYGNSAVKGSGLYLWFNSNPILKNIKIISNWSSNSGGGIFCQNSSFSIEGSEIKNNVSGNVGGGICNYNGVSELRGVVIADNISDAGGGGIYLDWESQCTMSNVTVKGNLGSDGGGIYCSDNSRVDIKCGLICRNTAYYNGAMSVSNSKVNFENVTLTENRALINTNGLSIDSGSRMALMNTIVWSAISQEIKLDSNLDTLDVSYSDINDGQSGITGGTVYWLSGNMDGDPQFSDTVNWYLQPGSPCIDAGNPTQMYNDPEDPQNAGHALFPALGLLRNDMGAYGGADCSGWVITDVENDPGDGVRFPADIELYQNYPNPFNPITNIEFSIPNSEFVTLKIYNLLGQEVAELIAKRLTPGSYKYTWDATGFASGVYLYKLETDDISQTKKLILIQ